MPGKESVQDILKKYGARIEGQMKNFDGEQAGEYSQSYKTFRSELVQHYAGYEKWAHSLGSFIRMKPSKKDEDKIRGQLEAAHVNVEPWQAIGLSVTSFVFLFFLGILSSVGFALIKGFAKFPILFFLLSIVASVFVFSYLQGYPERLAKKWRLKASSQMVPAILYIVVYMRHTPNLEKAVQFAAEHLDPPLALDFRKMFYDVEVGKYSTIKESLDHYLETWRGFSSEFIESFHLIESSLFEPDPGRRITTLEKALQVVLDGVYDKMLKFSHNVKSPLTNVYMLGVVMPTLGLALLPLASAMMKGMLTSSMVFVGFNLIIPFLVMFLTDKILLLRPGGHGSTDLLEKNPLYYKYKSNKPYVKAFFTVFPLIFLGLLPVIWGYILPLFNTGLPLDISFSQIGLKFLGDQSIFGFVSSNGVTKGPFGVGALILGMFIPIGLAIFFSMVYKEKTKEMIIERKNTNELEAEFNNSLFQLGNRLGNGVPPELVFGRVAESAKGLKTEEFFARVNYNIQRLGMSVESAIFDKNRGAILRYPSQLISTSMKILVEASKKGLKIAAVSLMSISEYVKNLNKITLRLKDLLAEVTGDMKSNMTFLAPLLSGIVVGLGAMITSIIGKLGTLTGLTSGSNSTLSGILQLFQYSNLIPPYFLQISVGIYLIQIIFILTSALVTIDSGEDKLQRTYDIGRYLRSGIGLYFITALFSVLALSILAGVVLKGLG